MLRRNSNPKIDFDLLTCQIWGRFTEPQPSYPPIASGYISGTVQIGVEGMSTHLTPKEPGVAGGLSRMAAVTLLASICRINIDHPDPLLASFTL